MPYTLLTIPKDGYLHLKATGENTPENVAGYLTEGIQKALQMQCRYVLLEENLEGPELELEKIREIIDELQFAAVQHVSAVAFVNTNPDHSPDYIRFAENFATNRRINVRVFRALADAEEWIRFESGNDQQVGTS